MAAFDIVVIRQYKAKSYQMFSEWSIEEIMSECFHDCHIYLTILLFRSFLAG
jgi:hypothetical protein